MRVLRRTRYSRRTKITRRRARCAHFTVANGIPHVLESSRTAYLPHQVRARAQSAASEETRSVRVLPTMRQGEKF